MRNDIIFRPFPKIARWSREVIITEKIDGTNASIYIGEDGTMLAGSRSRWITLEDDNFGFAAWVRDHEEELRQLGPGHHFGEWYGLGINRNYGLSERRWALFNVRRWCLYGEHPGRIPVEDPRAEKYQDILPECCDLVPIMIRSNHGHMLSAYVDEAMEVLRRDGSRAAPGYMNSEGVVIYHVAANTHFKKTLEKDDMPKGMK